MSRRTAAAQKVTRRIGLQLIAEKKAEIAKAAQHGEKDTLRSRDLLTLLMRANMSTDIPENQRLSDEDVLARECPVGRVRSVFMLTAAPAPVQRSPRECMFPVTCCLLPAAGRDR